MTRTRQLVSALAGIGIADDVVVMVTVVDRPGIMGAGHSLEPEDSKRHGSCDCCQLRYVAHSRKTFPLTPAFRHFGECSLCRNST